MTSYKMTVELEYRFRWPGQAPGDYEVEHFETEITYGYLSTTNDYVVESVSLVRPADVEIFHTELAELAEEYLSGEEGQNRARSLAEEGYNEVGYLDYPDPPFDEDARHD